MKAIRVALAVLFLVLQSVTAVACGTLSEPEQVRLDQANFEREQALAIEAA